MVFLLVAANPVGRLDLLNFGKISLDSLKERAIGSQVLQFDRTASAGLLLKNWMLMLVRSSLHW